VWRVQFICDCNRHVWHVQFICDCNRHVWRVQFKQIKLIKISYIGTLLKVRFIQDSGHVTRVYYNHKWTEHVTRVYYNHKWTEHVTRVYYNHKWTEHVTRVYYNHKCLYERKNILQASQSGNWTSSLMIFITGRR
jgi:hypothetical protein